MHKNTFLFCLLGILSQLFLTSCVSNDSAVKENNNSKGPSNNHAELYGPHFIKEAIDGGSVQNLGPQRAQIASNRWQIAIDAAIYAERPIPIVEKLDGKKTALIVIDMQRAFLDIGAAIEVAEGRSIVRNVNRIASELRNKGGIVVFFRYLVNDQVGMLRYFQRESYLGNERESPLKALRRGHPQFELYPELDVQKSDIIMDKIRYSAVLGSALVDTLTRHEVENVVITGVTTDVCAGGTAEGLMQKDFHVIMVWDGTAALDRLEHEIYLARIFGLYGDVMPTQEVLMRITL
ncbi:MAG: Peroxyureidoacrylate/ureidoacrylate amidohydrolase RutB [Syntrophorhabdaceae bacterium]|nr:Peroxyureidoacrylate/ureidoacrylate amidohydrolase RutB [Syntrophorhabdaceae bacterium]